MSKRNSLILLTSFILAFLIVPPVLFLKNQKNKLPLNSGADNISGGVRETPTEETQNWKTFMNTEEGFSLKYPNTWNEPTKNQLSTRVNYNFTPSNLDITTGFYYDQELQRPRTYDEELAIFEKNADGKKNLRVDNKNTTVFINNVGQSTTEATVILKGKNDIIIWISMPFPQGTDPVIFDHILSTFRFTDQTSITPNCRPRPACLDETPRCLIPETDDMCPPKAKPTARPEANKQLKDGCVISGCSSEICSEEEMFSTCVLKPENECYKTATCEKQASGKCGWTETSELKSCLEKY